MNRAGAGSGGRLRRYGGIVRRSMLAVIGLLVIGLGLGVGVRAEGTHLANVSVDGAVPQRVIDAIVGAVRDALAGHDIPGLMVGFRVGDADGAILCFGASDLDVGTPLAPTDSFYVGSTTKMLTATAVLQCVERGAVELDAPISAYLEGCPDAWSGVTVRHLLTHTSGIPSYIRTDEGQALRWIPGPVAFETVVDILRGQSMDSDPGRRWNYTNSNFYLLGHLVESVAGVPYATYLDEHLLAPLGLEETGYDPVRCPEDLVTAYHRNDAPDAEFEVYPSPNLSLVHGAGGVHTTMDDLLAWLDGWSSGRLLSAESLTLMTSPEHLATSLPLADRYGYGCMIWREESSGLPLRVGHFGQIHGHLCLAFCIPEEHVAIVLYSNSYDLMRVLTSTQIPWPNRPPPPPPLHERLAEIVLDFASGLGRL